MLAAGLIARARRSGMAKPIPNRIGEPSRGAWCARGGSLRAREKSDMLLKRVGRRCVRASRGWRRAARRPRPRPTPPRSRRRSGAPRPGRQPALGRHHELRATVRRVGNARDAAVVLERRDVLPECLLGHPGAVDHLGQPRALRVQPAEDDAVAGDLGVARRVQPAVRLADEQLLRGREEMRERRGGLGRGRGDEHRSPEA